MKHICLYFQVHQPFRFRTYRFFDIGRDHYYYDDFLNRSTLQKIAQKCYIPANNIILDLIKNHKDKFKVSFSITGTALEQFEMYAPEVIESFKRLAATGNVEFLAETYAHSLSGMKSPQEFKAQVKAHSESIQKYFGLTPKTFRNTELIYSDEIGESVASMGYRGMLTEGPKHVLGWKSPNFAYYNARNPKLKLLLNNFRLSEDISRRFSKRSWDQWPLTTEKFTNWLNNVGKDDEVVNLFMDYETFGEYQSAESGIFDFLKALPQKILTNTSFSFVTPAEIIKKLQPVGPIHVPYPISWADEEKDLTTWLGNDLQDEACEKLYELEPKIKKCKDPAIQKDWENLQASENFYYMCTKFFSDDNIRKSLNPYNSPYEAFINYMNILSDFTLRVDNSLQEQKEESQNSHQKSGGEKKATRKVKSK